MKNNINKYNKILYICASVIFIFLLFYKTDVFFATFLSSLLGIFYSLSSVFLISLSLTGIGIRILSLLKAKKQLIDSFLIGAIAVSQIFFISSLINILNSFVAYTLFIFGIISFFNYFKKEKKTIYLAQKHSKKKTLNIFWLFALISIFFVFIASQYPPYFSDEISYHLLNAEKILLKNSLLFDTENPYSLFPIHFELLYSFCISIFSPYTAKAFHFIFHLLTGFLVFKISNKFFSKRTSILSALIVYTTPIISFYASTAFITSGITVFFLASVDKLISFSFSKDIKDYILFTIYAAFLIILHHSAPFLGLSLAITFFILNKKIKFKQISIAILSFLIISFPYYARNFFYTNNPFYPVFSSTLFKTKNWNDIIDYDISKQFFFSKGVKRTFLNFLISPFLVTFNYIKFSTLNHFLGIGPIFILSFPFIFIKNKNKLVISILTISGIYFLFWFFFMPHFARFLFPIIPLLSILSANVIIYIYALRKKSIIILSTYYIFIITFFLNTVSIIQSLHSSYLLMKATGQFNETLFLKDILKEGYISAQFLNYYSKNPNENVAFFKDFDPYYCKLKAYSFYLSPSLSKIFMTKKRLDYLKNKIYKRKLYNCLPTTEKECINNLKKLKIKYIILNKQEYIAHKNNIFENILRKSKLIFHYNDLYIYELQL